MAKAAPKKRKKTLGSYPHFTVVFSITMSLFVIGLFALLFLHANKLSEVIKENIELHVYLNRELSAEELLTIKGALKEAPYAFQRNGKAQIRYISKEQAAEKFIKETGEEFSQVLSENPLRESFIVKINPTYFESGKLEKVAADIRKIPGVFEVDYPINLIAEINKNVKIISIVLIGFAVILLFTTVLLINNTIKLALYSQRFLIRSMQLVGATHGFIQRPFLWRAIGQGFFSGVLAVIILGSLLQYAYSEINELAILKEQNGILLLFGGLIVLGIIIGLLSSFRAVSRYLRMSLDELY